MTKTIILASQSAARRALLKSLGIKFRVVAPRVREISAGAKNAQKAVVANALLKARDVASRVKKGVVVACDTVVVQRGRVFGKPRDIKDARRMLKLLSRGPQVLYTGIAVMDVASGQEISACEATKIWMEPLTDREISGYFRKVSPLDKAGAFDIQGPGALFIRRIEGCYFNVVGLPLARLRTMLKKVGVTLLTVLACLSSFYGCATSYNVATKNKDLVMYSTSQEVSIGDSLSRQLEKAYIVVQDPALNERVQRIGEKLASVCDRREVLYRFRVIEDKEDPKIVNAVSLPGGYVYVFKELMKVADTDDELAAVLGHEVGHIVARHGIKRLQAQWGYTLLSALAAVGAHDPDFSSGVQLAYMSVFTEYAQQDELLADQLGARYTKRAGYDPQGMISFLKKMHQRNREEKSQPLTYFRTHPYESHRIRATKQEIDQKISFQDYLNTNE
jgi:septum formation protein